MRDCSSDLTGASTLINVTNDVLLKTLSQATPQGYLVIDNRTDQILYFNHRFCEIWGITHLEDKLLRGELKNNDIIPDCLPVLLDIPAFSESCKPLQSEDNRTVIEDEIPFKDGRTIRRFSSQIRGENDAYFGRFYTFEDITQKKKTSEALRENELKLSMATENAGIGLWEYDIILRKISINNISKKILGIDIINRDIIDIPLLCDCIEESDLAILQDHFRQCLMIENGKLQVEIPLKRKSEQIWLAVDGKITERDKESHPVRLVGTIMDITEDKNNRLEILKAKEDAEAANKHKNIFLASMSDDIRTPLSGIIGYMDLLKNTDLRAGQLEYVNGINAAADNLLYLVNDILSFSKLERGQLKLEQNVVFIRKLVNDLIISHIPLAKIKNTKIQLTVRRNVPQVICTDGEHLKQILNSLIVNALKCTTNGRISIEIFIGGKTGSIDKICFVIKDTRSDFDDLLMNDIFGVNTSYGSFLQQKSEGTGLRLAISKRLIGLMGGEVNEIICNSSGLSISFYIASENVEENYNLAIDDDLCMYYKNDTAVKLDGSFSYSDNKTMRSIKRILLAEDNPINSKIVSKILELHGIICDIAENGEEAIEAFIATHYDMIFMDCQMPVMDGYECTSKIRSLEKPGTHIPIIAITAFAMAEDREKCISSGMDDYMTKPISEYQILQKINMFFSAIKGIT